MIGRILGALSFQIRLAESEWAAKNPVRQRVRYGWLRRLFVRAAGQPIGSSGLLFVLFSFFSLIAYLGPIPGLPFVRFSFSDASALTYLSTIWVIQATIVALIYPIVIAFVTFLVQRLHQGQSVLHVYLHDSGAVFSGSSSLMLLLLMGIQYLLSPWTSIGVVLDWTLVSGIWLLLNIGFSAFFLFRTIEFLRPARRTETVTKYALNVAWPAEMKRHLRVVLFDNAVDHLLLPGPAYPPEPDRSEPSIWMGVTGRIATDSVVVVERQFNREKTLHDVYFRPLALATASWLKKANRIQARNRIAGQRRVVTDNAGHPVLIFPLDPEATVHAQTTLCSQQGTVPFGRKERLLVRCSFDFRRKPRDLELTIEQFLNDLKREAMSAVRMNEPQVYSRIVRDTETLLVSLIKASAFTNGAGDPDNYSNLPHRWSAFGRPVYQHWTRVLMDLFKSASNEIASNEDYFTELIFVTPRMFSSLDGTAIDSILRHLIELPPILFSRLGDWWVTTLEQQGTLDHGPCHAATLRPPYSGTYDSLVQKHVGAWETLKNECFLQNHRESPSWSYYRAIGTYFEQHLQLSVSMLIECVNRGDMTGSVWTNDILLKWISELEFHFDSDVHFFQRDKWITFEVLGREWDEAKTKLDIEEEEAFGYENVKKSVLSVALRNYWIDACCLLSYLLSIWGRDCECEKSLPALLLRSLLDGQSRVGGAHAAQSRSPIVNADELLLSILRQHYLDGAYRRGYRSRLDRFASRLAGLTSEVMLPGRIYSGIGIEDLDSLRDGQLALLVLVVTEDWQPSEGVERLLREWLRTDDDKLRSFDRDLGQWKDRLSEAYFERYRSLFDCLSREPEWKF